MDEIRDRGTEEELLDVYDADHRPIPGRQVRRGEALAEHERLLVAHVCIVNARQELLCQKRSREKGHYGGCWDLSAGGFVLCGEDAAEAAARELREELGLALPEGALRFLFTEPFSFVLDDYFLARAQVEPAALQLQPEEVDEARWLREDEVLAMVADGSFVDYPPASLRRVFAAAREA